VQTRREAVILMTAIPLLSTDAVAQTDRLDALFNHPSEKPFSSIARPPALWNPSLLHSTAEPPGTDAFEI
jgi:hypothetical protein